MSQKTIIKPARLSVALLASGTLVAIVAQMFMAMPARADCEYEGEWFPTGAVVASQVCLPNGSWKSQ